MSWEKHTIGIHVPEAISAAADGAQAVAGGLDAVVSAAASLVDVASAFYEGTADPAAGLVEQLITTVSTLVDDAFGTGVYILVVTPYNVGTLPKGAGGVPLLTPRRAIDNMRRSFDDAGDDARPQFSETAQTTGLGLLATAADVEGLISAVEALSALLDLPDLRRMLDRAKAASGKRPVSGVSRPPDWRSISMRSIPPFSQLYPKLSRLLENLRGATVTADNMLDDLSDVLVKRVKRLSSLADDLSAAIDSLVAAAGASGVYTRDIPLDTGGNERLQSYLRDDDVESLLGSGYTAGVLMVAGGPSAAGLEAIKELLL